MDWFWGKSTLKNQERLFNRYLQSQIAVFLSNDLQEIMDVTIQIWRYILLGCFTEKQFHNLQLILSSLLHCPVSPWNWHLDRFVFNTVWQDHVDHTSLSSIEIIEEVPKICPKKTWECISMYFPFRFFLHEIMFLHGKFIAVSQASTLDQYLANEDWSWDRVSSIYI